MTVWAASFDSARLRLAVGLAAELHGQQLRKGTQISYMSHLLAVAALVAEDNGSEGEVMAALLHDAAEDQGGQAILERIAKEVGPHVAEIVRECSDSILDKGVEKAPWHERKQQAIMRLETASQSALRVIAADKLHNTRATANDLQLNGPETWNRFKTGREGFLWYHEQVLAKLQQRLPASRSVQLLASELAALKSGGSLA